MLAREKSQREAESQKRGREGEKKRQEWPEKGKRRRRIEGGDTYWLRSGPVWMRKSVHLSEARFVGS